MSKAKFKVVCADVFNEDGTPIFDANYTYTTKSGVKVGFFGMETPETQTKANPALIKGLTFATGDAFTKRPPISRGAQGCGCRHLPCASGRGR